MMSEPARMRRPSIFLSHRYRSPEVNLFFWRLISEVQETSFRVDEGLTFTSPTRLERMIRDADAFVGIYPLPGGMQENWDLESLRKEARYFLLELGIAARSHRPAIVFCDHRYGPVLRCPPDIWVIEYDPQEITDAEDSSLKARAAEAFRTFMSRLHSSIAARNATRSSYRKRSVGLLLPPGTRSEVGSLLENSLHAAAWEPVNLPWPPRFDLAFTARLREVDWSVVGMDEPTAVAASAFVLGSGVPSLHIGRESAEPAPEAELEVHDAREERHPRTVLRWSDPARLVRSFEETLHVIGRQPRLIHDAEQAEGYFQAAKLRKEQVFLSYAREDSEIAAVFSKILRGTFQEVFDYRRAGSIQAGSNWMEELIGSLAKSAVGVLLLSPDYVESKYCLLEAQRLYRAQIEGSARLFPVRLRPTELPEILQSLQYHRLEPQTETEVEAAVSKLITQL
ncbi:toll/interleukin-1 receptor domain-containing protein [Kitasatospora sp. NPDC059795]|uniref:toll/interleukin-1 receptor domain-containing protein n=1 Tax=Kitasatospora sp. NPDC059795 TaxID=3346949 RepID=UPI00364AE834